MTKDYYKILGIQEFDSAENIKSAYRKLARKWHPDIAGNSQDVILKFKEINEAYEVLSNSVKRSEYDRARRFYSYAKEGADSRKTSQTETSKKTKNNATNPKNDTTKERGIYFNWEDFFSSKQKNTKKTEERPAPRRGDDIFTDVEISVFDAIQGVEKVVNMLQTGVCPKCGGRKFVNGSVCKHCNGKGEISDYKKFTVKIPAGVKDKSKIRLAHEGCAGINGGANGDLYITIHIQEQQNYKTDGLNILKTVPITPFEAVLGTTVKLHTISGDYSVKIAPYTQNGQKIRLSGCGIVQNNKIGDMIITIEIKIPKNLTGEEIELYKKLESISSGNIREDINDR